MICITICLIALIGSTCQSEDKKVVNRWQTDGQAFTIRVTELQDRHFPLSKFTYVFEAKVSDSSEWHEIMAVQADDDIPIPQHQVRFVDDRIAHVFMIDTFAITTNAGRSWSSWKVNDHAQPEYPSEFLIKEVVVNPNGSGTLVAVSRSSSARVIRFQTEDFGHSWIRI
jgi:hypothetical protein